MFGKVVIAFLLSMTFLLSANALPEPQCCADPGSYQVTIADGCCATAPCCILPGEGAQLPTTPPLAVDSFASAPAPATLVSLIVFPPNPHWVRLAKAPPVAHSPPPRALFCTYLI